VKVPKPFVDGDIYLGSEARSLNGTAIKLVVRFSRIGILDRQFGREDLTGNASVGMGCFDAVVGVGCPESAAENGRSVAGIPRPLEVCALDIRRALETGRHTGNHIVWGERIGCHPWHCFDRGLDCK